MNNVLTISFGGLKKVTSSQTLTQWDTGWILKFVGVELPEIFSVDFSYNENKAFPALGTQDGVRIPDSVLEGYGNLHAWFVLNDGLENTKTEYEVVIPVKQKSKPGTVTDGDEEVRADQYAASVTELLERAGNAVIVSESNVEKYPKIIDKYWYVYNPLTREWENTGVAGEAISIDTIVSNPDYTLTITLEDGRQFTTGSMRGEKGEFADVDSELSNVSTNPVENQIITAALETKVDKVNGKGLSEDDFTTAEKTKLSGVESGAQVNIIEEVQVNGTALTPSEKSVNIVVPTALTDLTNDGNFVQDASYVHTDTNFTENEKIKLAGVEAGAQVNTITGVKGNAEDNYRVGNVNITPANIGLGNVNNTADADKPVSTAVQNALNLKQNTLTFDSSPTENSTNPVTSDGIYTALSAKQNNLTFDSVPTENSTNPVTSGGLYEALSDIQESLTFDNTPTENSTNPVTSHGIYEALEGKVDKNGDSITVGETTVTEADFIRLLSIIDGDNIGYGDIDSSQTNVGQADHMIVADGHEEENTIDVGAIGYMILQHPENSIYVGTAIVGTSALAE